MVPVLQGSHPTVYTTLELQFTSIFTFDGLHNVVLPCTFFVLNGILRSKS